MKGYREIIFSFIIVLSTVPLFAQNGSPYITYFDSREGYENQIWSSCQDDHNAMLFASKKGLLRYNGSEWKNVPVPYLPLVIKQNPYTQKVYILSENNIGYLNRDSRGVESYVPLSYDGEIQSNLSDLHFTDSSVIVYGEDLINIYESSGTVLKQSFNSEMKGKFSGIIISPNKVYINVLGKGLYCIEGRNLSNCHIVNLANESILFSLPYDGQKCLLGTKSNDLYLFDGKNFENYKISNSEYFNENSLSGGLIINDSTYVFTTLYGGILLCEKSSGKIKNTLNYENGLPDDEVYTVSIDNSGGLWLTYAFGVCRIDTDLPIRDYGNYPGLEGLLTSTAWYKNELYVSTTEGLYYLSEVKNYEDVEMYFRKKTVVATPPAEKQRKTILGSSKDKDNERGRFLKNIFNRDKNKKAEEVKGEVKNDSPKANVTPQYEKRKVSKLKSIEHTFFAVGGLNNRCNCLLETKEGLLAGASSGLFVIEDHQAKRILRSRNIYSIISDTTDNTYIISGEEGLFRCIKTEDTWQAQAIDPSINEAIFSTYFSDNTLWISGYDIVHALMYTSDDSLIIQSYEFESVYPEELYVDGIHDSIFVFTSSGIQYFDPTTDTFRAYNSGIFKKGAYTSLHYFQTASDEIMIKQDRDIIQFTGSTSSLHQSPNIWGLFDHISSYYMDSKHGYWIIDDYSRIYKIEPDYLPEMNKSFKLYIEEVKNAENESLDWSVLSLEPHENTLYIEVAAPYFLKNDAIEYHYIIEGRMENWSKWSKSSSLEIYPEPGNYTIKVEAKNILNKLSEPVHFSFEVETPFYRTSWFYISLIPIIIALMALFIYMRERKLKRDKRVLEEKIQERTLEIQEQKQKIEIQKDEILAQKDDITSSITYASRIQHAILPATNIFEKTFSEYLIFFRPRDIVSGDFYWVSEMNENIVFAAADCTGHGVPGAFMSMLGNSFLNEITKVGNANLSSGKILDELRQMITNALSQSGENNEARDGMDMALCVYNKEKMQIQYSGAYNSIYLIREGELHEYKADRMPIGYYPEKKKFKTQKIAVKKNDIIYMFSDGFPDQFGGPKEKKYTTKRFKQLLLNYSIAPLNKQEAMLQGQLESWQGNVEQIDDILILGVKI